MKKIFFILWTIISINTIGQSEYYITSEDQTKLYVEELGSGEPVILISGGPGLSPSYFKPVWENLSVKYRTIILHQRGTGNSIIQSVDSISMSMENYTNDLEALRKYLQLKKTTLIGHSWGGMLALEYTSRYPNNVEKLILVGPGGPTTKFGEYFSDNIEMRLTEDDRKEADELIRSGKSTLKAIWPGYFFDRNMALLNKGSIDFDSIDGQEGVDDFTWNSYIYNETNRINGLKNYLGKANIIQGWQDPIGVATAYEISQLIPQIEINFIKQCGHFPWSENEIQKIEFYKLLNEALKAE